MAKSGFERMVNNGCVVSIMSSINQSDQKLNLLSFVVKYMTVPGFIISAMTGFLILV